MSNSENIITTNSQKIHLEKFDSWNIQKKNIEQKKITRYVHEREVWNAAWGVNIGHEQNGGSHNFRPLLVMKVFNKRLFLAVPLTSQSKKGKFYYNLSPFQKGVSSTVILSQLRIFDINRLSKKIGMIETQEFSDIKKTIKEWFD